MSSSDFVNQICNNHSFSETSNWVIFHYPYSDRRQTIDDGSRNQRQHNCTCTCETILLNLSQGNVCRSVKNIKTVANEAQSLPFTFAGRPGAAQTIKHTRAHDNNNNKYEWHVNKNR